jgi:hypothetical protein
MKDAAHLQALRGKIAHARAERVRMLASARAQCRHAREGLKARQARQRAKFVEEQRAARAAGKERCKSGKKTAGSKYNELAARTALREARTLQRQVRNADRRNVKQRSTIRERSQESDDAVRSNLPPELVPVFNAHRKNYKGSARRSRTEQFLEWAEENPDEIISIQSANAERELAELVREHTAHGRAVRKAGRYRQDPAALRRALAAVPF